MLLDVTSSQLRWLAVALALGVSAASVQAADVRWKDRGDRHEGIRGQNIGGGDFELLGVHVEPELRERGQPKLWVSVPLREPAKLRVRVWEPKSGYEMVGTSGLGRGRGRGLRPDGRRARARRSDPDLDPPGDPAPRTGRTPKTINEIIHGKTSITHETALHLEMALWKPASYST